MNKKKSSARCIFLTLILFGILLQAVPEKAAPYAKTDKTKLASQYQDWLDLVSYIITPTEKDVFDKLTTDRERDSFINLFWNLRDPSKGTPQNEFKDEQTRRFQYANQYFKYGAPGPGWKTDRGRIYIILGPPTSINEVIKNGLRPIEIWDYFGGPALGLPATFKIVFFKPSGDGQYKLYIPAVHGPYSLLIGPDTDDVVDPYNYSQLYTILHDIEPAVAEIAFNLVPGETSIRMAPSLQDSLLISKIYDLPKSKINAAYAKNFMNYKGIVKVNVTTNYVDLTSGVTVLKDPRLNLSFIHLALAPDRVSIEELMSDKLYFNYRLTVTLKKGEDFILQYDKDFPVYFTKSDVESTISQGIIIADMFPIIEGEYTLTAILQNSVTDEISFMERIIKTEKQGSSAPRLFEPILSYGLGPGGERDYAPFRIMGRNIKIDPKETFGLNDSIAAFFLIDKGAYEGDLRLKLDIASQYPTKSFFKSETLLFSQIDPYPFFSKPLESLPYGDYLLKSTLLDGSGGVLDTQEKSFHVSLNAQVPHPALVSKTLKEQDCNYYFLVAATEYEGIQQYSQAADCFKKAMNLNAANADLIKKYADFLMRRGEYDTVLSVIDGLKTQDKEAFSYYSLKGRTLFKKNEFHAAVEALLEANKIYDSDTTVLNTLGLALIRIGDKDEAIKVLSASLKLQNEQKDIQKLLLQLEEEKNPGKR